MVPRHQFPNPPQNPSPHGSGGGSARGETRAWQRHPGIVVALLARSLPGFDDPVDYHDQTLVQDLKNVYSKFQKVNKWIDSALFFNIYD